MSCISFTYFNPYTHRNTATKGCKQSNHELIIKMKKNRHWASRSQLIILCSIIAAFYVAMTNYVGQHRLHGLYQFSTRLWASAPKTANSKPRAILHIGPHKTSSTYIQSKLCEAQDQLAREGFVIPVSKSCPAVEQNQCHTKHFAGVAAQLRGDMVTAHRFGCSSDPLADLNDALSSIYSANDSTGIILSSEGFDYLDENGVAELANVLSNYQTTVVIYFRRKVEHLVSYYSELSKNKARNPLLSPLSLTDFFWTFVAHLDPEAGPNDPVPQGNGLCYKRLFDTYSKQFGAQNLAIFHYNGLLDAGKDPWEVLVQDVMMLGPGKGKNDNGDEEDLLQESERGNEERMNKSPSAFSSSVADYFYQWRWGDYSTASAIDASSTSTSSLSTVLPVKDQSSAGITNTTRSLLLPKLNCVLPLLKQLETILPKKCLDLQNVCSLWELQERQALTHLAGEGSQLLYFDEGTDNAGKVSISFRNTEYTGACQVDKIGRAHV